MPKYKIVLNVDGTRLDFVKKQCLASFGKDISAQVTKIEQQPSRADRLREAEGMVADAKGMVEELRGEMEDWKDNMPESLQQGSKAEEIDECLEALGQIESSLDDIDFGVSFPGMM
ncbi:MAG: hypothetical protein ACHQX3_00470 [Nitrospirales bacterium]